jgi:hypothetical protein
MAVTPFNSRLGYTTGLTAYVVIDETGGISGTKAFFSGGITAPNIVYSINGATGAVSLGSIGITTGAENTFTARQNFAAGISASGATFTGPISASNLISTSTANTFTALQTFTAGLSASGNTFTFNGPVIAGGTLSFGQVMDTTVNNRVIQNAFKITSKTGLSAEICRFDKRYYNMVDITSTVNIIDQNTTQGSWAPGLGFEPEPLNPGYFLGRKDLITHDGTSSDGTNQENIAIAICFSSPWPSGWSWQFGCNINGNDAILYLVPYTRQTAIFTGYYTLTPVGLTG